MPVRQFRSCLPLCAVLAMTLTVTPVIALAQQQEDPINADRPDFVDSSDVVGKGTLQVEMGLAVERNRADGTKERTTSTPLLLRLGVTDTLELRAETDGRMRYRADGADFAREQGWGDATLGVKWHARDGADGWPSLGMIVEADVDSGSAAFRGSGVQPAVSIAAEWELANGYSLGVMPGVGRITDDDGSHAGYGYVGIVLDKAWTDRFRTFVEFAAPQIVKARHGGTQAQVDLGAAWLLTRDCQLDAMLTRGLNNRTPDYAFTVGVSIRL